MTSTIEEDFELELRSLPGVVNVGIRHRDDGGRAVRDRTHEESCFR